jgi:hypothetical protein
VPPWLWAALPSDAYRTVLTLRRQGLSWRRIERETGVRAGNAATMAHEVARVAEAWPQVVQARAAGAGRREIARRLDLPRWAVRAVLASAPPAGAGPSGASAGAPPAGAYPAQGAALPPPGVGDSPPGAGLGRAEGGRGDRRRRGGAGERAGRGGAENGRTPAGGRSRAAARPPEGTPWLLLRTGPGRALRVKAEIERRSEARFGPGWGASVRCVALLGRPGVPHVRPEGERPAGRARLAACGWVAVQATPDAVAGGLFDDLPHARGWVVRSPAERRPEALGEGELRSWFRRLGWDGVPEAQA